MCEIEKKKFYLSENHKVFKEVTFYVPYPRNIKRVRIFNDGKIVIEQEFRTDEIKVNEETGEIETLRMK
ncbi:MAG: hypothetical protein ACFFCM_06595 [Promethearchaeota archaeon]